MKYVFFFLWTVFCFGQGQQNNPARTSVNCSGIINFPDANFKARLLMPDTCKDLNGYVIDVDLNGDEEIDVVEAARVGEINVQVDNITNLSGIECFINLIHLGFPANPITTCANVVFPTSLRNLTFYNTQLTTIDVSYLPNLRLISSFDTPITSLDLSNNHLLTHLYTKNCPNLTSINIRNGINHNVTFLLALNDCWSNCPNLTNVCVDDSELVAVQNYLANCGGNASIVNTNCALGTQTLVQNSFTIAPNPSSGVFEITFETAKLPLAVTVYNMLGSKVYSKQFTVASTIMKLDLTNYPSGVYLVTIADENNNQEIVKLIKR